MGSLLEVGSCARATVLGTIRASKLALVPEVTESTARTLLVGVRPRYTPIATASSRCQRYVQRRSCGPSRPMKPASSPSIRRGRDPYDRCAQFPSRGRPVRGASPKRYTLPFAEAKPVALPVGRHRDPYDRCAQFPSLKRPVRAGVAEGRHSTVAGNQPVALAVERRRYADDVSALGHFACVGLCAAEGAHVTALDDNPVALAVGQRRDAADVLVDA